MQYIYMHIVVFRKRMSDNNKNKAHDYQVRINLCYLGKKEGEESSLIGTDLHTNVLSNNTQLHKYSIILYVYVWYVYNL